MDTITKQTGKIKFFNNTKGYGFIITEDSSEVFVHATNIEGEVGMDDKVSFETKQTPKGLKAVNVIKI